MGEFGCDASIRGQYGWTPIHYACHSGNTDMVCMLISQFNGDASVRDDYGRTALHVAARNGHQDIIRLLVSVFGCNTAGHPFTMHVTKAV